MDAANRHCTGTDERAAVAEANRCDARAAHEGQLGVLVERLLRRVEERRAEAERHIARYKLPKVFVYVPDVLRSPAGKADYRWAKQVAAAAPT